MKKRAYVTGATGCVGRNLVEELLNEQWDVIVSHRRSSDISRLQGLDVRLVEVDLHDPATVLASVPADLDAIFHVAGNTSHWHADAEVQWKDNVLATRNLVQAAQAKKVKRFIFTSTGATHNFQGDEKFCESIAVPYIRSKRLGEIEVERGIAAGLDAVILNPIIVVGAYDYNSYSQIFSYIATSKKIFAFPGRLAFCHARDVANAHIRAFETGRTAEHYMLGGTYTSWLDFSQRIADAIGSSCAVKAAKAWQLLLVSYVMGVRAFFTRKRPMLTPSLVTLLKDAPDVPYGERRKAREQLGYESRPLGTMIEDCLHWMLAEGRLQVPAAKRSGILELHPKSE
jgi:dihydroflavonol-4-reductase